MSKRSITNAYQLFEDVVPYYKTSKEFEDIYYKMAYSTFYQKDYVNSENFFKTYLGSCSPTVRGPKRWII